MNRLGMLVALLLPAASVAQTAPLIVVADDGGDSALPYYRTLHVLPDASIPSAPAPVTAPPFPYREADMLPVRSTLLTPGPVTERVIRAPTLPPLFLIGDDARSRAWLRQRGDALRSLQAIGLVVNVATPAALADLRREAHGLVLAPSSGDDLARRLALDHYPVLITATGIEQ